MPISTVPITAALRPTAAAADLVHGHRLPDIVGNVGIMTYKSCSFNIIMILDMSDFKYPK